MHAIPLVTDQDLNRELPAFLVISADASTMGLVDAVQLQALSPRIMQWSTSCEDGEGTASTWIIDLTPCRTYWEAIAKRKRMAVAILLSDIVSRIFEDGTSSKLPYQAVLAGHPWQALLLLRQMRDRHLTGLISRDSRFGEKLFREFTWEQWWLELATLADHYERLGRRRFQASAFRSQCGRMQRAMKRLGLRQPSQLQEASSLSIKRRFGSVISEVWDWTFSAPPTSGVMAGSIGESSECRDGGFVGTQMGLEQTGFATGFPWEGCPFPEPPSIARHLDFPLAEWDHLQPLLREDLDRLCESATWASGERVVSLKWQLVFPDLTILEVPIFFRHPHSLHTEKLHQRTALLQAYYAFERSLPGSLLDPRRRREDMVPEPIVSWTLTISERLRRIPQCRDLFGGSFSSEGGDQDLQALLHLENRLPVPLEHFRLRRDWLPEDSYCQVQSSEAWRKDDDLQMVLPSLTEAGKQRPLFLYDGPRPFDSHGRSSLWQFSERTMAKWWLTHGVKGGGVKGDDVKTDNKGSGVKGSSAAKRGELQRDYYKLIDNKERTLWVYKDSKGKWYMHGIFA